MAVERHPDLPVSASLPCGLFLFDAAGKPGGLAFGRARGHIAWEAQTPASAFFAEIERALARGYWLAGYLTFEAGYALEPRLRPYLALAEPGRPLAWFSLHRAPRALPPEWISKHLEAVNDPDAMPDYWLRVPRPGISARDHAAHVRQIKSYIARGHTYQVNYTYPLATRVHGNRWNLFWRLLRQQPVGYAAWIKGGGRELLSFSPELFFRRMGSRLTVKPMKGTAPRSRSRAYLASSEKNRAENVMIVDLMRNDLGRLCRPGSVKVTRLCEVETYQTLHQMTSTVEGRLRPEVGWEEIFRAIFPCGSVTGAPKIRTQEIIAELEGGPRGVYTGALGFIAPDRKAVFNVPIRTLEIGAEGRAVFGIGSGIVADSKPASEWRESLLKAKFFTDAARDYRLLETLAWHPGEDGFRRLDAHLDRMRASAAFFHISFDRGLALAALQAAVQGCRASQRVRLLLDERGSFRAEAADLAAAPAAPAVCLSRLRVSRRNCFLYHKTTNRARIDQETRAAQARGCWDALLANEQGRLTEGTISNLFVRKGRQWLTPPVGDGLLPGVERQACLRTLRAKECPLRRRDLVAADEILLTNAVRGALRATLSL